MCSDYHVFYENCHMLLSVYVSETYFELQNGSYIDCNGLASKFDREGINN